MKLYLMPILTATLFLRRKFCLRWLIDQNYHRRIDFFESECMFKVIVIITIIVIIIIIIIIIIISIVFILV